MSTAHAAFAGSIPAIYDTALGPLLFEFSAADMAHRLSAQVRAGRVLEVACGTGISTRFLRQALPPDVEIVATDLNPAMLDYARAERGWLQGVRWEQADALALPYPDASFDAVVCAFGIMFFPDITAGLAEMRRVLKPGGRLICNVWDELAANPVVGLAHEVIGRFFASDPPTFLLVPFGSCPPEPTLARLADAGFTDARCEPVAATIERPDAREVARGLVQGNPGVAEIEARASASPDEITAVLAYEIERQYGPAPLRIPLRELVYEARKPAA